MKRRGTAVPHSDHTCHPKGTTATEITRLWRSGRREKGLCISCNNFIDPKSTSRCRVCLDKVAHGMARTKQRLTSEDV